MYCGFEIMADSAKIKKNRKSKKYSIESPIKIYESDENNKFSVYILKINNAKLNPRYVNKLRKAKHITYGFISEDQISISYKK